MKTRVFHVITKLELGGAQKVVLMTLERLPRSAYSLALVTGPEGMLRPAAERLPDVDLFWIPTLVRSVRPVRDFRAFIDLFRLFRRERPQIVHTHSSKAGILGRWAAWLAGVPHIFHTAHGFGFNDYQSALTRWVFVSVERITSWVTTRQVVVSRANAARAQRLGILRPDEWILCRAAVDTRSFLAERAPKQSLARWGIPENRVVVGMVACFKPQKSPTDFVDVAAEVLRTRPDVHFVMAGDGELRPQVEERIRESGVGNHITLLGWQEDMPELYANLDIFMLTSLWEGQPCVFAEAMACGLPIIATDADGAREAIVDGDTGFVCPPRDIRALAVALVRLIDDPELRRSMGQRGRCRAMEFDIGTAVARLESAYREDAGYREDGDPVPHPS